MSDSLLIVDEVSELFKCQGLILLTYNNEDIYK